MEGVVSQESGKSGLPTGSEKSLLCYKLYTAGGCDETCPYAHGLEELRNPIYIKITDDMGPLPVCSFMKGMGPETSFGANIRKAMSISSPRRATQGMHTWLMSRISGARIWFEDHETDPSMLKVKLEGTMEEVKLGSNMVRDHVAKSRLAFAPLPAALPPN
ncbi:hypothetical protein POM88_000959 [Heracleum sosnowskyi]|uniref:C3H1-type domain-containing protein n=1 Tax=Heracleum sosnowskyi TaxID=360622 RepID=A0AAD8JD56_9APIA|nr:hypothetical protein POM88_000762 [Heracleum sosnowskyi]KAK1401354.1 hypothetical protein POM88_000959 [Heracleum sosnowskyi]